MTVMVGGTRQEQLLKTDKDLLFDKIVEILENYFL